MITDDDGRHPHEEPGGALADAEGAAGVGREPERQDAGDHDRSDRRGAIASAHDLRHAVEAVGQERRDEERAAPPGAAARPRDQRRDCAACASLMQSSAYGQGLDPRLLDRLAAALAEPVGLRIHPLQGARRSSAGGPARCSRSTDPSRARTWRCRRPPTRRRAPRRRPCPTASPRRSPRRSRPAAIRGGRARPEAGAEVLDLLRGELGLASWGRRVARRRICPVLGSRTGRTSSEMLQHFISAQSRDLEDLVPGAMPPAQGDVGGGTSRASASASSLFRRPAFDGAARTRITIRPPRPPRPWIGSRHDANRHAPHACSMHATGDDGNASRGRRSHERAGDGGSPAPSAARTSSPSPCPNRAGLRLAVDAGGSARDSGRP